MAGKFKPGDRVVYRCDGGTGNPILDGKVGTVRRVGRKSVPQDYDVEFDDSFPDAMDLRHFGIKKEHGWACTEDHLEKEGGDDDVPSDIEKNKKEKEIVMANIMWTTEMDKKLLDMKAAGMDYDAMASEMNLDAKKVQQRLYYLRKVKGKFALTDKAAVDNTAAEKAVSTTQTEGLTHSEDQKGELNDLEKAMSETITELTSENDNLKGTVKDLEDSICKANEENTRLYDQIGTLNEKVTSLDSELRDTKTALAQTESQLDTEREALRNSFDELEKSKDIITGYLHDVDVLNAEIKKLNTQMELSEKTFGEILCKKDEQIALLEANCERYLNLIIGLTEERLSSHAS